jgi:PTH1 family peptidyl-tRNA hydrolase
MKYIVGLGNPENEYVGTRHNVGRDFVLSFAKKNKFNDFEYDKKINAQISEGQIGKGKKAEKVILILPDTYMNKSGNSLKKYITSIKKAKNLLVIQDDLDMGLGSMKIVFNKKSGGHKGIESIARAIKTKEFSRMKIGISPTIPTGKIKKPKGEEKVIKHVLGKFSPKEQPTIKKIEKHALGAIEEFIVGDYLSAQNKFN